MGISLQRILFLVRKEFRQLHREPNVLRMMFIAPMLQLFMYGYAVGPDLHDIPLAIVDRDLTAGSRALSDRIAHIGMFRVEYLDGDARTPLRVLDTGREVIVLQIPRGFERSLARGEAAPVQILADGTDSNYSLLAMSYLTGTIRSHAAEVQAHYRERHSAVGSIPELRLEPRVWYNPSLRNVNYMVPGIIGLILLTMSSNLTSLAIVREREIGTLEQLSVTPLRGLELILGKLVWPAIIASLDALMIVAFARLWFRVPMQGSLLLLLALSAGFMPAALGTGLLISTVTKSQQQAQMATFFFTMPSVLLSGLTFPIANMPDWAQALTYAIPLRYYLVIVRGIFLKGSAMPELWPQAAALIGIGLGLLLLGAVAFRKRLD